MTTPSLLASVLYSDIRKVYCIDTLSKDVSRFHPSQHVNDQVRLLLQPVILQSCKVLPNITVIITTTLTPSIDTLRLPSDRVILSRIPEWDG